MATTRPAARLRAATTGDLPDVKRLLARSLLPLEGLLDAFPGGFVVAEDGGAIAGVAGVETHGPDGLLRSVAVREDARGREIGAPLVRDRVDWAKARGLETLFLLTTTADEWFERLGFRRVDRAAVPEAVLASREFSGACPESAAVLAMPIGAKALRAAVRARYAAAASAAGGCGCGRAPSDNAVSKGIYADDDAAAAGEGALRASLGCGNPTALARLEPGEIVLDLGSGGGIDVLLSARRVGPAGKAYGLDMTDEMLALARKNRAEAGVENAEFLKGEIEAIPLDDASVDVVVSNCVINLTADKRRALGEAFRVLKPGGRLAIADVVAIGAMPERVRRSLEAWTGCIAGALENDEYAAILRDAGFEDVGIEILREHVEGEARFASAFIRARKK